MAEARITVDSGELESLLAGMADTIDLRGDIGTKIADILRADALRQFQSAGDPAWEPISESTVARKAALGYPRPTRRGTIPTRMVQKGRFGPSNILMMTGALLSSWTSADDPHHVEEKTKSSVSTGSDLKYAGTHQDGYYGPLFGKPNVQGRIPARPIRITELALAQIAELLEAEATKEK